MAFKKKQLAKILSELKRFKNPKVELEQYVTPGDVAAELLWNAYLRGDIIEKTVGDLGTGTGVLAIGAMLLGAKKVYALDCDVDALRVAERNAVNLEVNNIVFVQKDVSFFDQKVDTVVMNPPFGCQNKNADRPFLEKACEKADVVYSVHLAQDEVRGFIKRFVEKLGFKVEVFETVSFEIPRQFFFHEKRLERVVVDLYRFEKKVF
ncbi:MAG: 50S ribosomal protein L11 methyltransferase [Thermoplasmata archaeon]|nr:50S ribosomal protein L11 methyltransferase [Thermoplasmata archaeon]RLF27272.1 MAG: DNA methylase [Thermoplasmata archaeon]